MHSSEGLVWFHSEGWFEISFLRRIGPNKPRAMSLVEPLLLRQCVRLEGCFSDIPDRSIINSLLDEPWLVLQELLLKCLVETFIFKVFIQDLTPRPLLLNLFTILVRYFTFSMLLIIKKVPSIYLPISVVELSETLFSVIHVTTFVGILGTDILTLTATKSIFEGALEVGPITPFVSPLTIRFTIAVVTLILVTISKLFASIPLLQAFTKFTLITITIYPWVYTLTMRLTVLPFPNILVLFDTDPHPVTMLGSIDPFSFI